MPGGLFDILHTKSENFHFFTFMCYGMKLHELTFLIFCFLPLCVLLVCICMHLNRKQERKVEKEYKVLLSDKVSHSTTL